MMENVTSPDTSMRPEMSWEESPAAALTNSRPGRKPGREGGGRTAPALTALAVGLFLLVSLCGARVTHASPRVSVERLRAIYALDESIDESDGRQIRRKLLKLLARRDVKLFLKVIQLAEGGEPDLMVGGCRARNLKQHPALVLPKRCQFWVRGWGFSTASGNYQITLSNWKEIAPFLDVRDFSETSQALVALELIRRGGGAAAAYTEKGLAVKRRIQGGFIMLLRGNVAGALCTATQDWASSSCSNLPAGTKVVYSRLADEVRKSEAYRSQARRGGDSKRVQGAPEKVTTSIKLPGRAVRADFTRR
jgi:muramidase (phage lysozyme)